MLPRVLLALNMAGCATAERDDGLDTATDGEVVEVSEKATYTYTFYVSNPTGDCASALKLTAKGSKITKIAPSGGGLSWDSLTSSGASTLYDTWYVKGTKVDKDYTSATGCVYMGTITVKVSYTSTTKPSLSYWFYDCDCDHD